MRDNATLCLCFYFLRVSARVDLPAVTYRQNKAPVLPCSEQFFGASGARQALSMWFLAAKTTRMNFLCPEKSVGATCIQKQQKMTGVGNPLPEECGRVLSCWCPPSSGSNPVRADPVCSAARETNFSLAERFLCSISERKPPRRCVRLTPRLGKTFRAQKSSFRGIFKPAGLNTLLVSLDLSLVR